ncbi:MAG: YARHG domain-containing protein [Clostridia bacterium]|nr:YARHG domain-containing protein [Clostridia bacterium]
MKKIVIGICVIMMLFGLVACKHQTTIENNLPQNIEKTNENGVIDQNSENNTIESENEQILEENPYLKYRQSFPSKEIQNDYQSLLSWMTDEHYFLYLTVEELQLYRNIPFAVHGHDFQNTSLKEFFSKEDWYHPIENKTVTLSELDDKEKNVVENVDNRIQKLRKIETSVKRYQYDANKELVYSFYEEDRGEYRDYRFPYININSDNIQKLNDDIYDFAMPIIDGTYFECSGADYYYQVKDNILSISIEEEYGYGGKTGFHLNIDIGNGQYVSNSEMLAKYGLDTEKVSDMREKILDGKIQNNRGHQTLRDYFLNLHEVWSDLEEAYNIVLGEITDIDKWELIYVDNEQKTHIILELPTLAGAVATEFYDCIVEF